MKKQTFVLYSALLVTSILPATRIAHAENANLLKDASFEEQLPPREGGWNLFDNSRLSTDQARSGNRSIYNWGFSQTIPSPPFLLGTASGSFQAFPAEPGSRWRMTGYGLTPTKLRKGPGFGIVQISFFDDKGNDLGTVPERHAPAVRRASERVAFLETENLERYLILLSTTVTISPFLGLLGTVTGMISVFQVMAVSGSGNVRAMAAGVSQATVPTMAGMVGALSGVLLVTMLTRRAAHEVEFLEDSLTTDH